VDPDGRFPGLPGLPQIIWPEGLIPYQVKSNPAFEAAQLMLSLTYGYWSFAIDSNYNRNMLEILQTIGPMAFGGIPSVSAAGGPLNLNNQDASLITAYNSAIGTLLNKSKCAGLFGTKKGSQLTATDVLASLLAGGQYGSIEFSLMMNEPDTGAITDPIGAKDSAGNYGSVKISINTYRNPVKPGWYDDVSNSYRTYMLLHELGHALRFLGFEEGSFRQDDDSGSAQNDNKTDIYRECIN
jgi:hypothetical protein